MSVDQTISDIGDSMQQVGKVLNDINDALDTILAKVTNSLESFDQSIQGVALDAKSITNDIILTTAPFPYQSVYLIIILGIVIVLLIIAIILIYLIVRAYRDHKQKNMNKIGATISNGQPIDYRRLPPSIDQNNSYHRKNVNDTRSALVINSL